MVNVEMTERELQMCSGRVTPTALLLGWPMDKLGLAMILLTILLAGCGGSLRGDASAGPNPGGGFYGAPNIDIGRINP